METGWTKVLRGLKTSLLQLQVSLLEVWREVLRWRGVALERAQEALVERHRVLVQRELAVERRRGQVEVLQRAVQQRLRDLTGKAL